MSSKPTKVKAQPNTVADASSPRALAKQLNSQTQKFFELARRGNFEDIARLTTKDFSFIDDRGFVGLRAQCFTSLQSMVSKPSPEDTVLKVKAFTLNDVQTRVYEGVAIETMLYSDNVSVSNKAEARSESFNRTFRVTNVWVKQGEGWQVASTQLTPVSV
ncbi:MAG: nuclear transport factor 2 family protein [Pyrinomonadaceae bacterium]